MTRSTPDAAALRSRSEALRSDAVAFLEKGEFAASLGRYDEALDSARRTGDETFVDWIFACRAAAAAEAGPAESELLELKRILLRGRDAQTSFRAAYTAARIYELRRDYRKAAFYARLAGDRAREANANAEAAVHYERAVDAARHLAVDPTDLLDVWEHLGDVRRRHRGLRDAGDAHEVRAPFVRPRELRHRAAQRRHVRLEADARLPVAAHAVDQVVVPRAAYVGDARRRARVSSRGSGHALAAFPADAHVLSNGLAGRAQIGFPLTRPDAGRER